MNLVGSGTFYWDSKGKRLAEDDLSEKDLKSYPRTIFNNITFSLIERNLTLAKTRCNFDKINLKVELEIYLSREKNDYLIVRHNNELLDIKEIQNDYLIELINKVTKK